MFYVFLLIQFLIAWQKKRRKEKTPFQNIVNYCLITLGFIFDYFWLHINVYKYIYIYKVIKNDIYIYIYNVDTLYVLHIAI